MPTKKRIAGASLPTSAEDIPAVIEAKNGHRLTVRVPVRDIFIPQDAIEKITDATDDYTIQELLV